MSLFSKSLYVRHCKESVAWVYVSAVWLAVPTLNIFRHVWNGHFGKSRSNAIHYLDDFLLAGRSTTTDCAKLMSCFCSICKDLRVPLAQEKTLGTTSVLTFLGLEINTMPMNVKIIYSKSSQLKSGLRFMLTNNKVKLRQLQNLIGLLFLVFWLYLQAGHLFKDCSTILGA